MIFNEHKIILDLCGGTGSWSKPYKENCYDVRIIDPQEWLEDDYGTGDVRLFKKPTEQIYGILSAPPCTHFSGSGARWWKDKGKEPLLEGLSIVDACLRIIFITKPIFWALENPVGRLKHYIGEPKHIFQPYEYGDNWSKKTCLWGDFNIPEPINKVIQNYKIIDTCKPDMVEFISKKGEKKKMSKNYYDAFKLPEKERAKTRSITPPRFAKAFYEVNK